MSVKEKTMLDNLKSIDWADIAIRAIKTAIQTYLAAWLLTQDPFTKAGLTAPVAATVSAVWNTVKEALAVYDQNK